MIRRTAKDIFLDALDHEVEDRAAFVADACEHDETLRGQVLALLRANDEVGDFMAGEAAEGRPPRRAGAGDDAEDDHAGTDTSPADDSPDPEELPFGGRIGDFRLLRPLGEGGFGTVYLAEQTAPIERKVAVKVLKAGFDSDEILQRFHLERQALAWMDHPGIARILDAGSLEAHRPYFVMEYVEGEPITDWCDRRRLRLSARLDLFEQVCLAVRHAHQRGVIHRDLKPNNLLVTESDGRAQCRVIDFGIAKAATRDADDPVLTIEHQLVGTPQYMSPEQASGRNASLDTRTDIYSLGVVLYELLTGVTPFEQEVLRDLGPAGIHEVLCNDDPPPPSSRVRTLAARDAGAIERLARSRGLPTEGLRRRLRGELDAIAMKALERDRDRRYPTADAMAQDVRRFLDGLPVLAARYGPMRLLLKSALRHRVAAALSLAVVVGLSLGLVGALVGATRARRAAAEATAVNDFLRDVLGSADPSEGGGEVRLLDALRHTVDQIPVRFSGYPAQEILARSLVGRVFLAQTMHREAVAALDPAFALARGEYGPDDPRTLTLGLDLLKALAQGGTIEEIERLGKPLAVAAATRFGDGDARTLEARRTLAFAFSRRGAWAEAERRMREVRAAALAALGPTHPVTVRVTIDLAQALKSLGGPEQLDEAMRLLDPVVAHQASAPEHDTGEALDAAYMLGYLRLTVGRVADAARMFEALLARAERRLAADHGLIAETRMLLATCLDRLGREDEAGPLVVAAVESLRRRSGDGHPSTMSWMTRALPALLRSGDGEHGEQYTTLLVQRFQEIGHGGGDYTYGFGVTRARFLVRAGRLDDANAALRELEPSPRAVGAGGSPGDAASAGSPAAATGDPRPDPPPSNRAMYHLALGELLLARGDGDAAAEEIDRAHAWFREREQDGLLLEEIDVLDARVAANELRGAPDRQVIAERDAVAARRAGPMHAD